MTLEFIMKKALVGPDSGIVVDGNSRLTDLDFANDIALFTEDGYHFQDPTSNLPREATKIGLGRPRSELTPRVMLVFDQTGVRKINIGGQDVHIPR